MYKEVTHVIFDLDGLLLDSERGYDQIISSIANEYGKEYTHDVRMKILGTPEPVTCQLAVSLLELPLSVEEFDKKYKAKVDTDMRNLDLFEGAEKLILHLHKHNIPFALATSASQNITELKLEKHNKLFSLFKHKVMGTSDPEVKNGKPSPDIFLICASRFPDNPSPEKCLVFEDAPNGVKAACAAGMQVVMVPAKETEEELCKAATVVLNSLNDFKPELFGLPPF